MKSSILQLLLAIFPSVLFAQISENYEIEYQVRFNDAFDRGRKDRLHRGFLFIHGNLSRFYMIADEKYAAANEYDHGFEPDTNSQVYTDQSKGIMVAKEFGFDGNPFYLKDSLYPMHWLISDETRFIDALLCTKATCSFRGRKYEAWFCSEIALPVGPWKLGGLPGLIVDMKDDQENMVMRFKTIIKKDIQFQYPANVNYTMAEHIEKLKNLRKRLQGNARTAGSGDCISCQTQSQYEFYTWEIIPE